MKGERRAGEGRGCDEPVAYDADVEGAVLSHCVIRDVGFAVVSEMFVGGTKEKSKGDFLFFKRRKKLGE